MSEPWIDRMARDLSREGLGTVLCLGRTGQAFIEALPEGAAQRIVLLDPIAERASRSEHHVLSCAFGPTDGHGTLHQFNMASLDALRPATGLAILFPGLRKTGTTEVEIWSAATLIAQVDLAAEQPNLLILGAPGQEAEAIAQFADLGALGQFDYVLTPLPRLALYEGSADGTALAARLGANGFREVQRDETDPDQPLILLKRDHVWDALITERDALRQELDAAKANEARQVGRAYDDILKYHTALRRELTSAKPARGEQTRERDPDKKPPRPQEDMPRADLAQKELERLEAQIVIFQSILLSELP